MKTFMRTCYMAFMIQLLAMSSFATEQTSPPDQLQIAITVDDLPFVNEEIPISEIQEKTRALLNNMQLYKVKAIGFVNEDKLYVKGEVDARIGLLDAWLDAGMELGNHNFGHVGFQNTPLHSYEEAVLKGEVVTRWLLQARDQTPRYYRQPYTQTGATKEDKAAFETFLKEHGYAVAPFTIEQDDYVFAVVYNDALHRSDLKEAKRVQSAYLIHQDRAFDTFETMSQELFGRKIPQILLIHANRLNADSLDSMLERMVQRGYKFISLEEVLKDPAYASPDGYIGKFGPSWLRRWAKGMGKKLSVGGQPDPEAWIMQRYETIKASSKK